MEIDTHFLSVYTSYKLHANRDGLTWGQAEKRRVLGLKSRRTRKDSDRSCSARVTPGRRAENITNIHQCLHSLFLHPLCGLHSLLFPAWWHFCSHYRVETTEIIPSEPMPCPYQCCWQGQPRTWGLKKAFANQKLHYLYSCRVVFWRFPMDDLVMPIKKMMQFFTELKKINISSSAWVLIIHWHCLLPNNTAWIAAPVPSTPQPEREKGVGGINVV